MVWDDRSSVSVPILKSLLTGVMGTYDEELRAWFASNAPNVQLQLVGREGDTNQSIIEGATASACFSHHQVCLFCPNSFFLSSFSAADFVSFFIHAPFVPLLRLS
jgi:hypothetical protein